MAGGGGLATAQAHDSLALTIPPLSLSLSLSHTPGALPGSVKSQPRHRKRGPAGPP